MAVQAVIDYNKNMEGELYLLIADAEKCFDNLLLEDCGNELYRIGFPVNEIEAIEEMNRNITAEIETPFGRTENIKIERAVKQGSVMGPTMCIVETDRVNDINEKTITTIGAETEIESVIFVDDIMGMGTKSTIEKVGRNMREMEIKKKFTFSKEKTKIIKIETKKRKRTEEEDIPVVTVKKGRIEKTDKEKYLGEWINSKGDNKIKIEKKKEKIPFMIQQIRKYGNYERVGKMDMKVRMNVLDRVIMPTILYGMELWTNVTKKEKEELERIHGQILKGTFEQKITTPYWGIIAETGIWPINERVDHMKLMLAYDIMKKEKGLSKKIVEAQEDMNFGWYKEVKERAEAYGIETEREEYERTKKEWKEMITKKIEGRIKEKIKNECRVKTKLRNIEQWQRRRYIDECRKDECRDIMEIRLNMIEASLRRRILKEDMEKMYCAERVE